MLVEHASLDVLTDLLKEFYSGYVKPERRIAIQKALLEFESSATAWCSCSQYLYLTSDPYVGLYCLKVIENLIVKRWTSLADDQKLELRQFLQHHLFQRLTADDTHFMIKKSAKCLSYIACLSWPQTYPSFLEDLKLLISHYLDTGDLSKVVVGLVALSVSVEQLYNSGDIVAPRRKDELRKMLLVETVSIYGVLLRVIAYLCDYQLLSSTGAMLQTTPLTDSDPSLSSTWHSIFRMTESLATDRSKKCGLQRVAMLTWLECVGECLRILPVDLPFQVEFYSALYICSLLGSPAFLLACTSIHTPISSTTYEAASLARIGVSALACVQEVVERKDLSSEQMDSNLFYIFPIIQCHLELITGSIALPYAHGNPGSGNLAQNKAYNKDIAGALAADIQNESSCNEYSLRLIDILRYLMTNFFYRISHIVYAQGVTVFHPVRFLCSLHNFTFSSLNLESFCSCLNMWTSYFEYVRINDASGLADSPVSTYLRDAVLAFGRALLSRLFFKEASSFLQSLDEDASGNGEGFQLVSDLTNEVDVVFGLTPPELTSKKSFDMCEYDRFLRESLLTLAAAASLVPEDLTKSVLERHHSAWSDYYSFISFSGLLDSDKFVVPPKGQPLHRVHWALRDYATALQTVSFLFEHIRLVPNQTKMSSGLALSGMDFLQCVMQSLQISRRVYAHLPLMTEKLIRSDLIHVIVQTLHTLEAIILGNYIFCDSHTTCSVEMNRLVLTPTQRDLLVAEILCALEVFILSSIDRPQVVKSDVVQLCATRLFRVLLLCSTLNIPINEFCLPSSVRTSSPSAVSIHGVFQHFFTVMCAEQQRNLLPFIVARSLARTFLQYLSCTGVLKTNLGPTPTSDQTNRSTDETNCALLVHYIANVFAPYLSTTQMLQNPELHIKYLGLLNDAVLSVESSTSTSRRAVQSVLHDTGVFDSLVRCVNTALTCSDSCEEFSPIRLKFCTAYLTFFITFIRVLSQTASAVTAIPELLSQIVRILDVSALSGPIPVPLIDCLLDMFLILSKNRRFFFPLIGDLLDLCNRLLTGLHSKPSDSSEDGLSHLVCDVAQNNASTFQKLCDLYFAILLDGFSFFFVLKEQKGSDQTSYKSDLFTPVIHRYVLQQPDTFHRLMHILMAILDENQVDSVLVQFLLNKLHSLHIVRRFYEIPAFSQVWLPEIMRRLLDHMVTKRHDAYKDVMIHSLYHLVLSSVLPHTDYSNEPPKGLVFFISHFLPAYLAALPFIKTEDHNALISHFTLVIKSLPDPDVAPHMEDFARCVDQFTADVRHLRLIRTDHSSAYIDDSRAGLPLGT